MSIFHHDVNQRLLLHAGELKQLGLLPESWSWQKKLIKGLDKVCAELINDLNDVHKQINQKKIKNEFAIEIEPLISPLHIIHKDLKLMLKQDPSGASERDAKEVNEMITTINNILKDNDWWNKRTARHISRIQNIMKEVSLLLEENYPDRAKQFTVSFEQDMSVRQGNNSLFPAYQVLLVDKNNQNHKFLVTRLIRQDLAKNVLLKDIRQEYMLKWLLDDTIKSIYASEGRSEKSYDINKLKKDVFHDVLVTAAGQSKEGIHSEKTFRVADKIINNKVSYMVFDDKEIFRIIRKFWDNPDDSRIAWILGEIRKEYNLGQDHAIPIYENIYDIAMLRLNDKRRKSPSETLHWKKEMVDAAGSDEILEAAVRKYKKYKDSDEEKMRWIMFWFRDKLKEDHFYKINMYLEDELRKKGFEP